MKKEEKIRSLISYMFKDISEEKINEIKRKWTMKGLDTLQIYWHTYYDTTCHNLISHCLTKYSEKQLNLDALNTALKETIKFLEKNNMKYKINIKLITFTEKKVIHDSNLYVKNTKDLIKAINDFSNAVYMSAYVKINVEEIK